jgi:hypothetical protein
MRPPHTNEAPSTKLRTLLLLRFRLGFNGFVDCSLRIPLNGGLLYKAPCRSGSASFTGHNHLLKLTR